MRVDKLVMNREIPYLRELEKTAPRTATGRVTAVWAVIKSNLAEGKKLREVYEAAMRDGLNVPYMQFRVYIHRLRKRDLRRGLRPGPGHPQRTAERVAAQRQDRKVEMDPLRNLREQRTKTRGFDYDPFPREGLTE